MALSEEELQLLKRLQEAERREARPDSSDAGDGVDWRGGARALFQGVTAGLTDEISGAVGASLAHLTGNEIPGQSWADTYRDIRDAERAEQSRFEEENPKANLGLQLAGTLAGGGLVGAGLKGTRAAAALGRQGPAVQAGIIGAGTGALEGAGRSEGDILESPGQVAADTALGAGVGLVAGPMAQAATTVGGQALSGLHRRLTAGARPQAQAAVSAELGARGASLDDVWTRLDDLGEGAVPAMDPDLAMVARDTVSLAGAENALKAAQRRQVPSVLSVADDIASQRGITQESIQQGKNRLARAQKAAAREDYARAYAHPEQVPSRSRPVLDGMLNDPDLQRPMLKRVYEEARKSSQNRGKPLPQLLDMHDSADPMDWTWREVPGWREWDIIQRKLRHRAEASARAARAGQPGTHAEDAADMRFLRREVLAELDELNPAFREARERFAGPEAVKDAMDRGADVFDNRVDPDDFMEALEGMTDSERLAVAAGALRNFRQRMLGRAESRNKLFTDLNTPAQQVKLRAALGGDAVDALVDELERTGAQISGMQRVARGSDTMRQQAAREAMHETIASDVPSAMAGGSPLQAGVAAINRVLPTMTPAARAELGQAMLDPDLFRQLMGRSARFGSPALDMGRTGSIWGGMGGGAMAHELFKDR